MYTRVVGTGRCLPEQVLTNRQLAEWVDTSDEWIVSRTGIRARHVLEDDLSIHTLIEGAARRAIAAAEIDADAIDLILVATCTAGQIFPSAAAFLQSALSKTLRCPVFDLNAACSGFLYALDVADSAARLGKAKIILVVGADTMTRTVDWSDRSTCVLFGDGAGAVVLQAADKPGLLAVQLAAHGEHAKDLFTHPLQYHVPQPSRMTMNGREVYKAAVASFCADTQALCQGQGWSLADLDWVVPHQANLRIIEAAAKRLGVPMQQVVVTLAEQANTSAASVPMALDTAIRDGRIQRGHRLLLWAFGAGFTSGTALLVY